MKNLIVGILFFCFTASIGATMLRNGDILFQIGGDSAFSDAILTATAGKAQLEFDHAAILWQKSDSVFYVIEASPTVGVCILSLSEFLETSPKISGKPGVVVKRIKDNIPLDEAIGRALSCVGQPYDWYFMPDNGAKYCTELIYDSYLDEEGNHIFETKPMNFRDTDGNMPDFWVNLYKKLGVDVPEGIPGTNPNDMSNDPVLIEVYRFF